ncbi:hypothetical protein ANN_02910 [Periplaneta americana]|uniref:Uncharacterized protein n=1 Tax=Periplaneta americana TaxID=6978 RepID=A0ABQ8TYR8_PERAM|nr:hypothetical protein ANN_02910 [Periplaneta americana]
MTGLCEGDNEPSTESRSHVPQRAGSARDGQRGEGGCARIWCIGISVWYEAKGTQSCWCFAVRGEGGTKPPEQYRSGRSSENRSLDKKETRRRSQPLVVFSIGQRVQQPRVRHASELEQCPGGSNAVGRLEFECIGLPPEVLSSKFSGLTLQVLGSIYCELE